MATETPEELFADKDKIAGIGLDLPKITKFSERLKDDVKKVMPKADFGTPLFEPEEEARAVCRAVMKAGREDVK
jgi:hypothetical protein